MNFKDRTKFVFAESMIALLKKKDLKSITVTELCSDCKADRKTFYNHFEDKYDLAAWIMTNYFNEHFSESVTTAEVEESISYYSHVASNYSFYNRLFSDPGISDLLGHVVKFNMIRYEEALRKNHYELTIEDYFALKMFVYGGINITREWVINGCKEPAQFISRTIFLNSPEFLKKLFI